MEQITVVGAVGLFVAGFVACSTRWQRRVATAFERIPVGTDRSAAVAHRDSGQRGDALVGMPPLFRHNSFRREPGGSGFLSRVYPAPVGWMACP